jgi:hypothetical protein
MLRLQACPTTLGFVFSILGVELRALHMLSKSSTTELHPQLFKKYFYFEIGSHYGFSPVGFGLWIL